MDAIIRATTGFRNQRRSASCIRLLRIRYLLLHLPRLATGGTFVGQAQMKAVSFKIQEVWSATHWWICFSWKQRVERWRAPHWFWWEHLQVETSRENLSERSLKPRHKASTVRSRLPAFWSKLDMPFKAWDLMTQTLNLWMWGVWISCATLLFSLCFKLFVRLQTCLFLQVAAFLSVVSPTSFVRSGVLILILHPLNVLTIEVQHFQERRAIGRTRAGISPNCVTDMLTPRSTSYAEQTCINLLHCVSIRFPVAPPNAAWQGVVYMPKDKTFASEVSCTTLRYVALHL